MPSFLEDKVLRRALALLIGVLSGFFWLWPVFTAPDWPISHPKLVGPESIRYFRIVAPLLAIVLIRFERIQKFATSTVGFLAFFTFIIIPLLAWITMPTLPFGIATCGPVFITGSSLLILSSLDRREFLFFTLGVALSAGTYLFLGLRDYGLEPNSMYGRPRVAMGFYHPVQTSSAIVATGVGFLIATWNMPKVKSIYRLFGSIIILAVSFWLLDLADSRNMTMACVLSTVSFLIVRNRRLSKLSGALFVSAITFAPLFLATYSIFANATSNSFLLANRLSSERVSRFRSFISNFFDNPIHNALLGPSSKYAGFAISDGKGFASIDSVYLSFLGNFGVIAALLLQVLMLLIGIELLRKYKPLSFGFWCGIGVYFLVDAQGLTPSNLIIFTAFAFLVNTLSNAAYDDGSQRSAVLS